MPWRSASELRRLRLKRPECLVRPDAKDAIFFLLMNPYAQCLGRILYPIPYVPPRLSSPLRILPSLSPIDRRHACGA